MRTLACKSTSQKGLEAVMACRQELVPKQQLVIEVGLEVKLSAVPPNGQDNVHCAVPLHDDFRSDRI
jgi:hypothetical protein